MSKINLIDMLFYKLEEAGVSPFYMGGAMILDSSDSPYPMDGQIVANHLAARMEKIPLMRKKLVQDRLKLGNMRLVDDPEFNVNNHITRAVLKAPGGYDEFTEYLGEFSAQRLDLSRPLWHYEVIEGLEGGRLAIALHLHHSILDGMGAQKTLGSIWSTEPEEPEQPTGKGWQVEPEPSSFELIKGALTENANRLYKQLPSFLLKSGAPLLKATAKALAQSLRPGAGADEPEDALIVPTVFPTSLNNPKISPVRVISYLELPLAEVKNLRRALDCTMNDLALTITSSAVEYYFDEIGEEINFDLVGLMPVNKRSANDDSVGNALGLGRLSLHNQIPDLEKRLRAISRDASIVKKANQPNPDDSDDDIADKVMGMISPIILDVVIFGIVKFGLMEKARAGNVPVTNIPGAPVPMYFAGAKQIGSVPMAPVGDNHGMTVTITSTDELFIIAFHGCGEAIKDKELFVEGSFAAYDVLWKLSGNRKPSKARSSTKRKKAPAKPMPKTPRKAAAKKASPRKAVQKKSSAGKSRK